MGKRTFTREAYEAVKEEEGVGEERVTDRAERQARETGVLDTLVDPAGFNVIRLSLPRLEKMKRARKQFFQLTVGTPMPVETRVDTTGSMGGNVDVAMRVLPNSFEFWTKVLLGYDIQVATGIFGDVCDRFPLCRPQFEMVADKIVKQLTLMVPLKGGGDTPEDPDLGIFGGAYLVRAYINRIGLKGYDFTVTDAPGRGRISENALTRVFGDKVFEKVEQNGHRVSHRGAIDLHDVWNALLDRAHAFVLQVGNEGDTTSFWHDYAGKNRVVKLPDTEYVPHVQSVIMGLTEGTLTLTDVPKFLKAANMSDRDIKTVANSVANIPIAAQTMLPNFSKRPVKGDLFEDKPDVWEDTNLWPVEKANRVHDDDADDSDKCEDEVPVTPGGEEVEKDDWL